MRRPGQKVVLHCLAQTSLVVTPFSKLQSSTLQMILKHSLVTIKNVQMFLIHHPLVNIQPDPLMSDSGLWIQVSPGGVLHRLCPVLDLKT